MPKGFIYKGEPITKKLDGVLHHLVPGSCYLVKDESCLVPTEDWVKDIELQTSKESKRAAKFDSPSKGGDKAAGSTSTI